VRPRRLSRSQPLGDLAGLVTVNAHRDRYSLTARLASGSQPALRLAGATGFRSISAAKRTREISSRAAWHGLQETEWRRLSSSLWRSSRQRVSMSHSIQRVGPRAGRSFSAVARALGSASGARPSAWMSPELPSCVGRRGPGRRSPGKSAWDTRVSWVQARVMSAVRSPTPSTSLSAIPAQASPERATVDQKMYD
jgi:hypothetical protein